MAAIGRSLNTLWVIFKHEIRLYLISPVVYLIGAVWLFFGGVFFMLNLNSINSGFGEPTMQYTLGTMSFLMLLFAPALTMRLVAEEFNAGTHELLFTSPVRDWEIIVGKWLAVWVVSMFFVLGTFLHALILLWRGNPDPGLLWTSYVGLWLLYGATLAIGVMASSISRHQAIAFFVGLGILVFMWIIDFISQLFSQLIPIPFLSDIMSQMALHTHYGNTMLQHGIFYPLDITYFVAIIAISLILATQLLGMRRWRA